jgi:hypothetical protein
MFEFVGSIFNDEERRKNRIFGELYLISLKGEQSDLRTRRQLVKCFHF